MSGGTVARGTGPAADRTEVDSARPRVLLTLVGIPWPANAGKRMRGAAILEGVCRAADVDVLVVVPPSEAAVLPPGMTPMRFEQALLPERGRLAAAATAVVHRVPWQVAMRDWAPAREALASWPPHHYDVAWFGSLDHALYLGPSVSADHVVVDSDDVETTKLEAFLALPPSGSLRNRLDRLQRRIELPLWRRVQRAVAGRADTVLVCSDLDRDRFGAPQVAVVPNTYPDPGDRRFARAPVRPVLLLVANYSYEPNADAAVHGATTILPLVRARRPDAVLRLVGRGEEHLTALRGLPGVEVSGPVTDLEAELTACAVAVAPVRYGGGTRLKLIEAMAWELPAVSTTLGCEGLDVVPGLHLEVADDPAHFADACCRLLDDERQAAELAAAGRDLYERAYRPPVAWRAIADILT